MGWYETCEYCGQQAKYAIFNCNCQEEHICTKLKLLKGKIVKKAEYDDDYIVLTFTDGSVMKYEGLCVSFSQN